MKNKTKGINPFTEKCICDWSKDDEFGFLPYTDCPAHGKETKKFLEGCTDTAQHTTKKNKTADLQGKSTAQQTAIASNTSSKRQRSGVVPPKEDKNE